MWPKDSVLCPTGLLKPGVIKKKEAGVKGLSRRYESLPIPLVSMLKLKKKNTNADLAL